MESWKGLVKQDVYNSKIWNSANKFQKGMNTLKNKNKSMFKIVIKISSSKEILKINKIYRRVNMDHVALSEMTIPTPPIISEFSRILIDGN